MSDRDTIEALRLRLADANNVLQISSVALDAAETALHDLPPDGIQHAARAYMDDFRKRLDTYRKANR